MKLLLIVALFPESTGLRNMLMQQVERAIRLSCVGRRARELRDRLPRARSALIRS